MTNHQDITSPFIMASFRRDSTLVLTTAPTHRNVDYNNYLVIVKDALKDLKLEGATLILVLQIRRYSDPYRSFVYWFLGV
jgi:hypothetical protein